MSNPNQKPQPNRTPAASAATPSAIRPRRRRWVRWLLAFLLLCAIFVGLLPNIIALPMFRGRLIDTLFAKFDAKVTVGDLSLGWLSPIVVGDLTIQPENTDRAEISVQHLAGDTPLWRLIFGHRFGQFRVEKPELFVQFDKDGSNIARLLRGIGGSQFGRCAGTLDIVDGRLLLQGPNSTQPWKTDGVSMQISFIPAADSPEGVAILDETYARLLKDCELTPEMANDIFKYIVPFLAEATRTSGRVSLELHGFHWPLGKAEQTKLQGKLTLAIGRCGAGATVSIAGRLDRTAGAGEEQHPNRQGRRRVVRHARRPRESREPDVRTGHAPAANCGALERFRRFG